jgi:catechol 2,3-dioxygenase-like lactoylglutathione lyase family enzyme
MSQMKAQSIGAILIATALTALPSNTLAQLHATGSVTNGHYHFNVGDVDAHVRFWVDTLGGTQDSLGNNVMVKFPNAIVLLREQQPDGDMIGSTVNHVAFTVPDLRPMIDKLKSAGFEMVTERDAPPGVDVVDDMAVVGGGPISGFAYVMGPDDIKLEVLEIRDQEAPIVSHHLHLFGADPVAMQAWYTDIFGAEEQPGPYPGWTSARLPGLSMNFTPSQRMHAGTAGRAIDHIGFEIDDLESFVAGLAAKGIEAEIREIAAIGLKLTFITDPWGTYIELTEGLDNID